MKWLRGFAGLVAIIGGLFILWGFLPSNPFEDPQTNAVRLVCFWSGGAAVVLSFRGRHAVRQSRVGRIATLAVVFFALWNVLWVLLSLSGDAPFGGSFSLAGFVAGLLGWLAASLYGVALVANRTSFKGFTLIERGITQLASSVLVIAGLIATFGMDRLGLTRSEPYGEAFGTLGALGAGAVALSWLMMGIVLFVSARRGAE
jgi:hypothetical protein